MHENQATDTLPDLLGAVPAIESVDLKAPVVFTRQLAQPDRVHPSGLSLPIISPKEISRRQIRLKKIVFKMWLLWIILIRFILSRGLAQGSHMKLKDANASQGTHITAIGRRKIPRSQKKKVSSKAKRCD